MVGMERSMLAAIAEKDFQLAARSAVLSFIEGRFEPASDRCARYIGVSRGAPGTTELRKNVFTPVERPAVAVTLSLCLCRP
jgi:hypothetical protein